MHSRTKFLLKFHGFLNYAKSRIVTRTETKRHRLQAVQDWWQNCPNRRRNGTHRRDVSARGGECEWEEAARSDGRGAGPWTGMDAGGPESRETREMRLFSKEWHQGCRLIHAKGLSRQLFSTLCLRRVA